MSFEERSLRTGPTLGNGTKKNFPYDSLIYSAEEIEVVKLDNTTLAETVYSYDDGDFTVTDVGNDNGGEIILAESIAAPTSWESILCRPKTKLRQELVLTEGGKVPMVALMKALDLLGFRICELWEVVGRTLVGGASTIFTKINGAVDGRALKFKDNGDGTWSIEPSASDPDAASTAVAQAEAARDAALGYASDAGDDAADADLARIASEAAKAAAEAAAGSVPTMAAILSSVYPVGSVYINAGVSTNPATLFGFGTWAAYGAGRVIVGLDAGQTEFDTLGETGGAKTHTLSIAEMPIHDHRLGSMSSTTRGEENAGGFGNANANGIGAPLNESAYGTTFYSTDARGHDLMENSGGGLAHNNLQPYIVAYMWKRTA